MSEIASRATLRALEFPQYLALVASEAATDLGQARLLGLVPTVEREELARRQLRHEEVARLLLDGAVVPSFEEPLEPLFARLSPGQGDVAGRDLVLLATVLGATQAVRARVNGAELALPVLEAELAGVEPLDELRSRIERALDPRGEVRDDASPKLGRLRRDVRRVRDRLYRDLKGMLSDQGDHFSEETVPLHAGRLVLMLNAGSRGRVGGLVHGRSGTGKSFYFEPFEAVEPNNELQSLLEDERREKQRILTELIEQARVDRPAIEGHLELLAALDAGQAACRWARLAEARLAEIGERFDLALVGARHPLLDPRLASARRSALGNEGHVGEVVPLDLALGEGERILVVTGPNAGGKTAALKTLGLLTLAHQSGLPIPVEPGTRLPLLGAVVATIGDEQDLLADQSTFSGRLLRLKEVWERAGEDSLVLLDELGSGTDPEEGAALSTTLLEGLLERGTLGLITTHLATVAALAMESDGASCAAMQFDEASGRPTFRLRAGAPGGSHAIDLARRMGLPEEWLERAEESLGDDHRRLRTVLAELEELREEVDAQRGELERQQRLAAEREAQLDLELERVRAERAALDKNARAELREFRQKVQKELRAELDRVAKAARAGRKKGVVGKSVERLFEAAPVADEAPRSGGVVAVGDEVEHLQLGWNGVVERMEKGKCWVRVRGMSIAVAERELRRSEGEPAAKGPKAKSSVASVSSDDPGRELKLIGQRVEEGLETLDRYLDRALLGSHDEVRVVHGHGSGRLRSAVREHLRGHPAVDRWRRAPDEQGGDGATLVALKR